MTYYENSNWSRAYNQLQYSIACEVDIITQYLQHIYWVRVQSLPSFQALRPCSVRKLFQTLREVFSLADRLKMYNKTILEFGFRMLSWIMQPPVCVICLWFMKSYSTSSKTCLSSVENAFWTYSKRMAQFIIKCSRDENCKRKHDRKTKKYSPFYACNI